jgi:hypothetical protein
MAHSVLRSLMQAEAELADARADAEGLAEPKRAKSAKPSASMKKEARRHAGPVVTRSTHSEYPTLGCAGHGRGSRAG